MKITTERLMEIIQEEVDAYILQEKLTDKEKNTINAKGDVYISTEEISSRANNVIYKKNEGIFCIFWLSFKLLLDLLWIIASCSMAM